MNDPIVNVVAWWRSTGVSLNPPADDEELGALARVIGGVVPSDLDRFYRLANGMVECGMDDHEVSFWSIARVLAENDVQAGADDHGPYKDIAFADWMIESWRFYLRLQGGEVVAVFAEDGGPQAKSLSDFFRLYLAEPCPFPV